MIPAQPHTIKQSQNKAYRLIKSKCASMEAFKANLVHLLNQIGEKESEENVKIHFMDFLNNTLYRLNEGLNEVLSYLRNNPEKRVPAIAEHIGKSIATTERYLKTLRESDLVEFKGSSRTGGYVVKK